MNQTINNVASPSDRLELPDRQSDYKTGTKTEIVAAPVKMLTDSARLVDDKGATIETRDVNIYKASTASGRETGDRDGAVALSNPVDTQTLPVNEIATGVSLKEDGGLEPALLQEKLDGVKEQRVQLIILYGQIPVEKMLKYKLAALYIEENILTRMLNGASSQKEAFVSMDAFQYLLPSGAYGNATEEILNLWKLPSNKKYLPEKYNETMTTISALKKYLEDVFVFLGDSTGRGEGSTEKEKPVPIFPKIQSENTSVDGQGRGGYASFVLTRLDKIVLVFYHLYQEFDNGTTPGLVSIMNIDILNDYFDQLMLETALSPYERNIADFIFLQTLSRFYHKLTFEYMFTKLGYTANNASQDGQIIKGPPPEMLKSYNSILHKMTVTSINRGSFRVADYWILDLLATGFLLNYRWKGCDKNQLAFLCSALAMSAKQEAECALAKYTSISIAEVLEDVDAFERISDDSSKYNTIALLTMLWNNLGFSRWPYPATLNPEKALEYLEFIQDEVSDQQSHSSKNTKESIIDVAYCLASVMEGKTPSSMLWSERIALYFYMSGEPAKASSLLEFTKNNNKGLYIGLAMASRRQYELAIRFLEKGKGKDIRISALIGVLYEKLINQESEQHAKHEEWLKNAETNYRTAVKSRPEINKNLARVLESRGDMTSALRQWQDYRSFLNDQLKLSGFRPVRFKLPLELRLVNEKITGLEEIIVQNKSDKHGVHHADIEYSGNVEVQRPGKKAHRKKGGQKTKSVRTAVKTAGGKRLIDGNKEAAHSVQVSTINPDKLDKNEESLPWRDKQAADRGRVKADKRQECTAGKHRVTSSPVTQQCDIPSGFSVNEVAYHWELTRPLRNDLTNRLLRFDVDGCNFDGVFVIIEQCLADIKNPVAQLHFIQNKEWLLRCKSFDKRELYIQSRLSGKSIQKIKAELRLSVLDTVWQQVETIYRLVYQCKPSPSWSCDPLSLLEAETFGRLKDYAHPEFFVQFGAQFSTAAHVMHDISYEFTRERSHETCRELYGHSPDYYSDLADKFYSFRNYIDPLHISYLI